MDKWIMHVDMDAFFASVEQYRNHPNLQGKPVCVGHDPKGGYGRGVVRSASYEARAFGIRSGMPVSKAFRLCPSAVFLPGEFSDYAQASNEIMDTLREFADDGRVNRASIDEGYLEVTARIGDCSSPVELAREVQATVRERTKLPCSIGVACNMTLAKVATGRSKPNGVTVVQQGAETAARFLAPLNVRVISGVGEKTAERLREYGIETLGQVQQMSIPELWPIMGRGSYWLHEKSLGIDERPLLDSGPHIRGSMGKDHTFTEDVEPSAVSLLHETLNDMCIRIGDRLKSKGLLFRTLTVRIRYEDYTTVQHSRTLPVATDRCDVLDRTAADIFDRNRLHNRSVRLVGVRVTGLSERNDQMSLAQFL